MALNNVIGTLDFFVTALRYIQIDEIENYKCF